MDGDLSELYSVVILGVFGVAETDTEPNEDKPPPEVEVVQEPKKFRTMFGTHH